jgi:hypothetical protein
VATQTIVRTYKGSQGGTAKASEKDAALLASQGYFPISQSWASAGSNADLILWHGLLSIVYVWRRLMRPAGTLTVTYEYRSSKLQRGESDAKA